MRKHEIGALPVVREDQLVGIITEQDFIQIAGNLLDETLGLDDEEDEEAPAPESNVDEAEGAP
jgi:CBS domain-containing protein